MTGQPTAMKRSTVYLRVNRVDAGVCKRAREA